MKFFGNSVYEFEGYKLERGDEVYYVDGLIEYSYDGEIECYNHNCSADDDPGPDEFEVKITNYEINDYACFNSVGEEAEITLTDGEKQNIVNYYEDILIDEIEV